MPGPELQTAWFCLRSQPKHEHIAAGHLRGLAGVEVFLPRVRFRRNTRQGVVWVTEALFPNYLFARFNWRDLLRQIHHCPGVAGVIHFGNQWPTVPDEVLRELRALFGNDELHVLPAEPKEGDEIQIAGGAFHGLNAVIERVMPARKRVMVLLEFLGRQTSVELPSDQVVSKADARGTIL